MAFHHLAGATTLGAADAIVDWFATFEAWIRDTVGWTIAAGAGTDNLRISSIGEGGLMTMLFVHVWRLPGTDTVRTEVSDDVIPTHETTRGNSLDSGGAAQFKFFMSADMDAIVFVWKSGEGYHMRYAGLLEPFAQNPVDETYYSCSAQSIWQATILRRFDNVWDQDDLCYWADAGASNHPDRDGDVIMPLYGVYFADQNQIAGQFKHIACRIVHADNVNPEDTIVSNRATGTSTWVVLGDELGYRFALRTGGQLPAGPTEVNHAYATGNAAAIGNWFVALTNFMLANGWGAADISGLSGRVFDWEYNSVGESGTDDIWVRVSLAGIGPRVFVACADSPLGTPGRHENLGSEISTWTAAIFPANYHLVGDADMVFMTIWDGTWWNPAYGGKVSPAVLENPSSPYMNVVNSNKGGAQAVERLVLAHDGVTWNQHCDWGMWADGLSSRNCNPNAYDGTTYVLFAAHCGNNLGVGGTEVAGTMKYLFTTEGGGIANLDTITDGAEVFTIFSYWWGGLKFYAIRTDVVTGVNFPGRRLYPNYGNVSMSPMLDTGVITKTEGAGLQIGAPTADFNVKLRGLGQRRDTIPGH